MDVFDLRNKLVSDYSSFVHGFINIRNQKIKDAVETEFKNGFLWPDPLIQLSPFFKPGKTIDDMVRDGLLHPECAKIFRVKKDPFDTGTQLRLHYHQSQAVMTASTGKDYVLTTGTGSGKSLSYIVPVVNHVLETGSGNGVKAIIVYPMNALANSQEKELEKFIKFGYSNGAHPVTFRRYTGQESDPEKNEIRSNPPDIILTNYVMLELILTRPDEDPLVKACRNLKFLVLDELHTYRGRQGADVAMLVRRAKEATKAPDLQCVGTSATLTTDGTWENQSKEVARVASLLFGNDVSPENIIGETLQRTTVEYDFTCSDNIEKLRQRINQDEYVTSFEEFRNDALASWIESVFGICTETTTERLVRQKPRSISGTHGCAEELARITGLQVECCSNAIQKMLLSGYSIRNPENNLPVFAFRIHQFISRGDTVYASPESPDIRHITLQRQQFVPDETRQRILLPMVFCRHCGQEFYSVLKYKDSGKRIDRFTARDIYERIIEDEGDLGFLYYNESMPWPDGEDKTAIEDRVPEDWKDVSGKILPARKKDLPKNTSINAAGFEDPEGMRISFMPAPFRFCPCCRVSYSYTQRSDFAKLSALGTEGRSTAATILSLSAIRHIRNMDLPDVARKLLSFTDNRQDASLQAGHFNDFIEVGLLRGALYTALKNTSENGLRHSELTQKVFEALDLPFDEYASNPEASKGRGKTETENALRNVLGYHLYRDLKRGWRVTAPNLEQTGLLEIEYMSLDELAGDDSEWINAHPALSNASSDTRFRILKVLLDWMRRELAVKVTYLEQAEQERIIQQSHQRLVPPWGFDESEQPKHLVHASVLYPKSIQRGRDYGGDIYLSSRSGFGQYLRRKGTFQALQKKLATDDTEKIINDLLSGLVTYGIIEKVNETGAAEKIPGYQIVADAMIWKAGDGNNGCYDPIRQPTESDEGQPVNDFFKDYYQIVAISTFGLSAKEHTAQVPYKERENREERFRDGKLPVLFCSPTMELGIDISQLNIVNMRNVPPTPANYAQRSGRAGRSGQPALIFTYCSSGSPHDQYFFKRPEKMVAGSVAAPQIDLGNEDLLKAHIYAIWLSESKLKLGKTLTEILDISGDEPKLDILPHVAETIMDFSIKDRAAKRSGKILKSIENHLENTVWFSDDWLNETMKNLAVNFDSACERWRGLFRSALRQQKVQNQIILDASRSASDKEQAKRLRREAESQLELLTSTDNITQSDFYSYRYFASEGFLPGYSFPRLPLSAFIPGRRIKGGKDEYLSRPRFLAITEFGPRSLVYHEGSRYVINQVILPARDEAQGLSVSKAKICPKCGYLHSSDKKGYLENCNNCEHCNEELGAAIPNLFRMQNVVAKRRDQINCDEEERLRLGFDIKTTVCFATRGDQKSCRTADIVLDGECIARMHYGDAATIWRINLGYRKKKKDEAPEGFWLDTERGYWKKRPDEDSDDEDPMSPSITQVRPYAGDTKNCLLFEPCADLDLNSAASFQSAFKNAVQTSFELEDMEIAAESMPSKDIRKSILFYESAEGGAGVLRQIMETKAFRRVIRAALEICHFDPDTGEDLKKAPGSRENCDAACYDCIMSYSNQTDHELLDRKLVQPLLMKLKLAEIKLSSSSVPRQDHIKALKSIAGSELEKKWLDALEKGNYALPSHAQELVPECSTRPDFVYRDKRVAIFVDGPHHDHPEIREKDRVIEESLDDYGWYVIRFRYDSDWKRIIDSHQSLFGEGK